MGAGCITTYVTKSPALDLPDKTTGCHSYNSYGCRVSVYHYVTKSREDFEAKVLRGGGAGVSRTMEYFDKVRQLGLLDAGQR